MDYFYTFLTNVIPINILELLAAIAGTYYLRKKSNTKNSNKYLVYFLWFTFFTEMVGSYAPIAYFSEYKYFGFVKDTVFERNTWLYNIYTLISFSFFLYYFRSFLFGIKTKEVIKVIIVLYLLTGVFSFFISDFFFEGYNYSTISGTILILFTIILFYFDLLRSDKVLNLKWYLPVYISVGVLVFNLCFTPLDIFSQFFDSENDIYVMLRVRLLLFANILMYTTFIIGFLICSKEKTR